MNGTDQYFTIAPPYVGRQVKIAPGGWMTTTDDNGDWVSIPGITNPVFFEARNRLAGAAAWAHPTIEMLDSIPAGLYVYDADYHFTLVEPDPGPTFKEMLDRLDAADRLREAMEDVQRTRWGASS